MDWQLKKENKPERLGNNMNTVKVTRKTTESEMSVVLDFSPIRSDYREKIKTPIPFLNHMIEHIAWRGGFNIDVSVKLDKFLLTHVICEDLGIAFGKALAEYINKTDGVVGYGDAIGIIDEAKAETVISFESRALMIIDYHNLEIPAQVEGMDSQDLAVFLDGLAQGASCTLQIDVLRGVNSHHIWEAVFRSVGQALNGVCKIDETRKGMTSGVAGKINWTIE